MQRHFFSLKTCTYPLILGYIKINGLITSYKYPILKNVLCLN